MKAITQRSYGSTDVLELSDIDEPDVGPDAVLVQVAAAGLDRGVVHLMEGLPYVIRTMGFGFRRPKHPVPGQDLAGRVVAVGRDVTRFTVGDEVLGTADGTWAEVAVTTEDRLVHRPSNLDAVQAAAVATSGVTALQAVRAKGGVQPGDRVLVLGASGGVGTYAVQVAAASGAEVTGVCSPGKADFVRALGATDVIDHTREAIDASGRRWDVVIDGAGGNSVRRLRRVLTPTGTLVLLGGEHGGRVTGGTGRWLRALALSPFVGQTLTVLSSKVTADDLQVLAELIEAGDVLPAVDRTFPLADAARSIDHMVAGRVRGKVVIVP